MTPYEQLKKIDACSEALEWVERHPDKSLQDLWDICPRSDWMFWLLEEGPYNITDTIYREMAYEFAANVMVYTGKHRNLCCDTLEMVSRYIDGDATDEELGEAEKKARASWDATWDARVTSWATKNAMRASWAASWAASRDASCAAARAASWAASWVASCEATQADIIRHFIPILHEVEE